MEYIFQPPPMVAVTFAVPRPPAGTLPGDTLIESDTGPCAAAVNEHKATANKASKEIEKVDLKIRLRERTEQQIPISMVYARETSGNLVFIRKIIPRRFDAIC
jgi:hypothetical protein